MGSGVLLAALVVLWFVVLVPMVVTRGDAQGVQAEPAGAGRTLQRRRSVDPVVHAKTERVSIDRDALRVTGELHIDVHSLRRRTLGGLASLALLAAVGAMVWSPWLWTAQLGLDLAVAGYLLVLRKLARRERLASRRAARAAAREALRVPVQPVEAPLFAGPPAPETYQTVAQEQLPMLPHPSVPLAPVHPLHPGRVVAVHTPAPAGWQQSAVVGLDDDDIGFADIDVYQPRRVVNA